MPHIHKALAAASAAAFMASATPLFAQGPAYQVVEISGQAEAYDPESQQWGPLGPGRRLDPGSKVRTGPEGSVDLAADAHFENMLRIGPDSRVTFLDLIPLRIALDEGSLFVLKEEQRYVGVDPEKTPELRILTRNFLVSVRQGGCKLESTQRDVVLKVFSESVRIQPMAENSYSSVPFTVEEGFQYSPDGWTRLSYPDYVVWQAWYKKNNERKDDLVRSRH